MNNGTINTQGTNSFQSGNQQVYTGKQVRAGMNERVKGLIFLAIGVICFIISVSKFSQFTDLKHQVKHAVGTGSADTGSAIIALIMLVMGFVFSIISIVKMVKKPRD
ncbi:MAG: hypothetical protein IJ703_00905 [Eubacterium sp.]|nr:hypothetical protein [Eubacterium sp.]